MQGIRDAFSHRQRRKRRGFVYALVCLVGYVSIAEGLALPAGERDVALPAVSRTVSDVAVAAAASITTPGTVYDAPIQVEWDEGRSSGGCLNRVRCRTHRRVPYAPPALAERAQRLGVGSRDFARRLLARAPSEELRSEAGELSGEGLLWPVQGGNFGRGFGYVRRERRDLPHLGIDVVASSGTPIRSVENGLVIYSDDGLAGYGNVVVMVHGDGTTALYAHCQETYVVAGQRVARGQIIGAVGETGIARGPHLHFELRRGGQPVNAMPYLSRERF